MKYSKLQKYFPHFLIGLTIVIGFFILLQRGVIVLPSSSDNKSKSGIVPPKKSEVIDVLFTGKEYKLSYAETPTSDFATIVKFDKSEQWQGVGSIEEDERVLGGAVLSLADRSRQKASAYLLKDFNLSSIDTIKLFVNLKTYADDLEVLNVLFGNRDLSRFYRYPLSNLKEGINYLTLPKSRFFLVEGEKTTENIQLGWDKIERVEFELISRPGAKSSVDIGWVRGEKEDLYLSEWNWDGYPHFFNLDKDSSGKTILLVQNIAGTIATFKKVGSAKDFDYSAKITSLNRGGSLGLFFRGDYKTGYGYYLTVKGLTSNVWSISKYGMIDDQLQTVILLDGQISNFEFSKNQPFWLKASVKGNKIIGYLSFDGGNYTKLGELSDNDFAAGGIGISISNGAIGYFDEFSLTQ